MKANENHIFVDTNVLIGAYSDNERDKKCLQYLFSLKGKMLYISTLSIAQLVSVFQKKRSNDEIKNVVRQLLAKFTLISFTSKDIEQSLCLGTADMEDNIQYVISSKFHCFYFITNNRKDYVYFSNIEALTPKEIRNINQ
jgi:predicted nucleic acid-binding protein